MIISNVFNKESNYTKVWHSNNNNVLPFNDNTVNTESL